METTEAPWWKKRWVRFSAFCAFFVVAFLFAFVYLGTHMNDILHWKADSDARAFDALLEKDRETLIALEKADTYGSTTPEGTIALIITALEAGDIELASKYYYVLDQEKAKVSLEEQLAEKGNLGVSIIFYKDLLNKGIKKCNEVGNGCTFRFEYPRTQDEYVQLPGAKEPFLFEKGTMVTEGSDFKKNEYTEVWKGVN